MYYEIKITVLIFLEQSFDSFSKFLFFAINKTDFLSQNNLTDDFYIVLT